MKKGSKVLCLTVAAVAGDAGRRLGEAMDDTTIRTAVDLWFSNRAAAMATYGHVSTWETRGVTNMSYLFCAHELFSSCNPAAESFDDDVGAWDTSRVTDMSYMFAGCPNFNQDIGDWRLDRVTDMRGMFDGAEWFDQDLGWCVADDANLDDAFSASGCESTSCGIAKGPRLYAKECGGDSDGCGGDLLVGDGDCDGDWECAGDLRCGIDNCGEFRSVEEWARSSVHWDLTDDCCYEHGVLHDAPEDLRVVCPAAPEKKEDKKDVDDNATVITAGAVLLLVLLAFCASQRRWWGPKPPEPEPPEARAVDPEAGVREKTDTNHDLERENEALKSKIHKLNDELAKAAAPEEVEGVVVAREAEARTEETRDAATNTPAPGGPADLAMEQNFVGSIIGSGSGSDSGSGSGSAAGSDVRREDITRPPWPDYHSKKTPGAMEAGIADASDASDASDADQNESPRTPTKSTEKRLLLEYKKLKEAQRQKRQKDKKEEEHEEEQMERALSYNDVVTGRRDRKGETCMPS